MRVYEEDEPPPRRGVLSGFVALSSWAVTALAALLVAGFLLIAETHRPGPNVAGPSTSIVVPQGAGVNAIGRQLQAEGVIRSALAFRGAAMIYAQGRSMKAGEYAIPARASLREVIEQLAAGKVLLHPITAPEGWTTAMVLDMVAASEVLDGDMPAELPGEGELLPETYRVQRGTTRAEVIRDMQEAHKRTVSELWEKRAPNLPLKTPEEAVILASIVEKETGVPDERPRVAAVFVNRLRKGMRLESDPTIIYGVSQGRPLGRGILRSELDKATPYNTYKIDGLPPTPIANPGRAALAAVLNPPDTKDIFFVADGTGGHAFAATLAEHERNVAKWRAIEKARAAAP